MSHYRYLELLRRTIRKPTIITMNNEDTMRPDISQTDVSIELASRLLFPLPSDLGPKLGRELEIWRKDQNYA